MEKYIKTQILKDVESRCRDQESVMKKLRFLKNQEFKRQEYTKRNNIERVTEMMGTKLDMWNIGKSLGKGDICKFCNQEKETIEHITKCQTLKQKTIFKKTEEWVSDGEITNLENLTDFIKTMVEMKEYMN